jgi:hypothetical protein
LAPSSSNAPRAGRDGAGIESALDRAALAGLALGLALYVMPWWSEGRLRWAFWLTLVSTLANVWVTHRQGAGHARTLAPGANGAVPPRADDPAPVGGPG